CAKGRFFETAGLGRTTELPVLDDDGRWQTVALDAGDGLFQPTAIAHPWASTFIVQAQDQQAIVAPGQEGPLTATVTKVVGPRLDDRFTLITPDGQILALDDDAHLKPIR